jgi:cytochrome c-type biogenesis protein CcmF
MTGQPISVGPPFYAMTFGPLMVITLLIVPVGPLLAWKRGDLAGALQRLWVAAAIALASGIAVIALAQPRKGLAAAGVALGAWVMCGAVAELLDRVRAGKGSTGETVRRLKGLPRGAWGTTFAHFGLGLFIIGACLEPSWKTENAQVLAPGQSLPIAGYQVKLDKVGTFEGPNYTAERAEIVATKDGQTACAGQPEKRVFADAGGQSTSHVMICLQGLSDLYVVLGDNRTLPGGASGWLVTAHWNPWARLIWLGPMLMALGGLVSLSDRRLRFALPKTARAPAGVLAPEPAE